ncbi:hypothetical protein COK36_31330 [Bacillus cereus]|nr:hypothetical protein COJ22_08065 [Bacillus cereus]PFR54902.1 hypothetical protein COK36_31330 [Bacillus cereus]PGW87427.1 hypothetical protein COE19_30890 [Bacillus cereus]PGY85317.1 hypothetical protein COE38_28830 [Bacillus cereus]PGZ26422.1 hypothetical protein COE54_26520 [Bacillus cereus]
MFIYNRKIFFFIFINHISNLPLLLKIIIIILFITYNYYYILLLLIIQMIIHFPSVRTLHSSLFTYNYIFI